MKIALLSDEYVRAWLRKECKRAGGIRAFGRLSKISAGHISRVLRGEKQPGEKVLGWLGLEVAHAYRRRRTTPGKDTSR